MRSQEHFVWQFVMVPFGISEQPGKGWGFSLLAVSPTSVYLSEACLDKRLSAGREIASLHPEGTVAHLLPEFLLPVPNPSLPAHFVTSCSTTYAPLSVSSLRMGAHEHGFRKNLLKTTLVLVF